jgi:glutathione S-transferase
MYKSITDINNSTKSIKLIGFEICPYVHRVATCLINNSIDYDLIYIDIYGDRPSWFSDVSPLGRVPVLIVNGRSIYESNVILNYLNDYMEGKLLPANLIKKALYRSHMEYANEIQNNLAEYFSVINESEFVKIGNKLYDNLLFVNEFVDKERLDLRDELDLVDCCYSSLFKVISSIKLLYHKSIILDLERVDKWSKNLLNNKSVQDSLYENYNYSLYEFIASRKSFLSSHG